MTPPMAVPVERRDRSLERERGGLLDRPDRERPMERGGGGMGLDRDRGAGLGGMMGGMDRNLLDRGGEKIPDMEIIVVNRQQK